MCGVVGRVEFLRMCVWCKAIWRSATGGAIFEVVNELTQPIHLAPSFQKSRPSFRSTSRKLRKPRLLIRLGNRLVNQFLPHSSVGDVDGPPPFADILRRGGIVMIRKKGVCFRWMLVR